jgi:hypothetical protein
MHISAFLIALSAVGAMGFANQRGNTCTVGCPGRSCPQRDFQAAYRVIRGIALGWRRPCSAECRRPARLSTGELCRWRGDDIGRIPGPHWSIREQGSYFRPCCAARLRRAILPCDAPWILSRQPGKRASSWSDATGRQITAGRRVSMARRSGHPPRPRTSLYARQIHAAERP